MGTSLSFVFVSRQLSLNLSRDILAAYHKIALFDYDLDIEPGSEREKVTRTVEMRETIGEVLVIDEDSEESDLCGFCENFSDGRDGYAYAVTLFDSDQLTIFSYSAGSLLWKLDKRSGVSEYTLEFMKTDANAFELRTEYLERKYVFVDDCLYDLFPSVVELQSDSVRAVQYHFSKKISFLDELGDVRIVRHSWESDIPVEKDTEYSVDFSVASEGKSSTGSTLLIAAQRSIFSCVEFLGLSTQGSLVSFADEEVIRGSNDNDILRVFLPSFEIKNGFRVTDRKLSMSEVREINRRRELTTTNFELKFRILDTLEGDFHVFLIPVSNEVENGAYFCVRMCKT
jgi:hypothetical protein